ncbi:hypothetical protein CLU79DRAFT_374652 [Phycomyces nitens]|nr:hypothetical protein CLU79DRAFT_374652 [Phycomyces nitens]
MEASVKSFQKQALVYEKDYGDLTELKRKTEVIVDLITVKKEQVLQLKDTNIVYQNHILEQHEHMSSYLHNVRLPTVHGIQKMENALEGKVEKEVNVLCKIPLLASPKEDVTLNLLKDTVNPLYRMSSSHLLYTLANLSLQFKMLETNPIQGTVDKEATIQSELKTMAREWRKILVDDKIPLPLTIVDDAQEPIDAMLYASETFRVHVQEQEDAFVLHAKSRLNHKQNMLNSTTNTLNSIRQVIDERQWLLEGQWEDCKLKDKTFKQWTSDIEKTL